MLWLFWWSAVVVAGHHPPAVVVRGITWPTVVSCTHCTGTIDFETWTCFGGTSVDWTIVNSAQLCERVAEGLEGVHPPSLFLIMCLMFKCLYSELVHPGKVLLCVSAPLTDEGASLVFFHHRCCTSAATAKRAAGFLWAVLVSLAKQKSGVYRTVFYCTWGESCCACVVWVFRSARGGIALLSLRG